MKLTIVHPVSKLKHEATPEEITLENFEPETLFGNSDPDKVIEEVNCLANAYAQYPARYVLPRTMTESGKYFIDRILKCAKESADDLNSIQSPAVTELIIQKDATHLLTTLKAAKEKMKLTAKIETLQAENKSLKEANTEPEVVTESRRFSM